MSSDRAATLETHRHRKTSPRTLPYASSIDVHSAPTAFFLRAESDMKQRSQGYTASAQLESMPDHPHGVQSLEETLEDSFPPKPRDESPGTASSTERNAQPGGERGQTTDSNDIQDHKKRARNPVHPKIAAAGKRIISNELSPSRASSNLSTSKVPSYNSRSEGASSRIRRSSDESFDRVLSPSLDDHLPGSTPISTLRSPSPRSFRVSSDEEFSVLEDTGSQVIQSSSGEEEEDETMLDTRIAALDAAEPEVIPQLVMPSIAIPSRRPFTTRGKQMGRMRLLVAGGRGVGKTSLIRSIVETCQDIVQVDPPVTVQESQDRADAVHRDRRSTGATIRPDQRPGITEIHASTKPLPSWWEDVEQGRILKKRRTTHDVLLERNLTFIDMPGGKSHVDVVQVVESMLRRTAVISSMTDVQILNMLSGSGGSQVDSMIYILDSTLSPKCIGKSWR